MADELTVKPNVVLVNGIELLRFVPDALKSDQTNARLYNVVYEIGTSEESVSSFGDVATPGLVILYNHDSTNYVEWGFSTGVYGGQLTANDGTATKGLPYAQFNGVSGGSLFLKANTAACKVSIIVADR